MIGRKDMKQETMAKRTRDRATSKKRKQSEPSVSNMLN